MMKAVFGPAAAAKRSQGKTESGVEIEPPQASSCLARPDQPRRGRGCRRAEAIAEAAAAAQDFLPDHGPLLPPPLSLSLSLSSSFPYFHFLGTIMFVLRSFSSFEGFAKKDGPGGMTDRAKERVL